MIFSSHCKISLFIAHICMGREREREREMRPGKSKTWGVWLYVWTWCVHSRTPGGGYSELFLSLIFFPSTFWKVSRRGIYFALAASFEKQKKKKKICIKMRRRGPPGKCMRFREMLNYVSCDDGVNNVASTLWDNVCSFNQAAAAAAAVAKRQCNSAPCGVCWMLLSHLSHPSLELFFPASEVAALMHEECVNRFERMCVCANYSLLKRLE